MRDGRDSKNVVSISEGNGGMNYNRICIMCPTYMRSKTKLPVFINSAISQVRDINQICFSFCVSQRDTETQDYLKSYSWPDPDMWEMIVENTASPNLALYFNLMYNQTKFNNPEICVSEFGDDMRFVTQDYDQHILDLVNSYDGIGCFWCNDDYIARERCCVNLVVTRKFVEATEEPFMCEKYPADLIDVVWTRVGRYTKSLHFLPHTVIKHEHESAVPDARQDETYKRLIPFRKAAHDVFGKSYATALAQKIANRLIAKGFTGDNV